ncbi:MAG TPA: KUP/HAK/KT family potassium transporter, partial [Ilumatobacteraceae bacterium]|nr:KUP/HAK/KT family potassium transporter [Ilumatobacteraceae bacterium]
MTSVEPHATPGLPALAFGTLGIVYGDIGTSPIYAFREAFDHSELVVDRSTAFGVASVVFWSLVIII